jgi:glycerophosphoryl diester phosphodiesterase
MRKRNYGDTWKTAYFFIGLKLMNIVTIPMIWHLKKRGIMTYYWVCNTEAEYQRAIDLGCTGIMTDDPPLLNNYLARTSH